MEFGEVQQLNAVVPQSVRRYEDARRRALFEDIVAVVLRQSDDLLSFEDVRRQLGGRPEIARGLQTIALDQIIGSVGRSRDFNRAFLPRASVDRDRWSRLDRVWNRTESIPPIDVYKVGDVYFVLDGNHRVSVARANGATQIEAWVTEISIQVPLQPDDSPDELILKAEYARFLEQTHLDQLRSEAAIEFTSPGGYRDVIEHIRIHQQYLAQKRSAQVPWDEAVASWFDHLYQPVVDVIQREEALRKFPGRTEADLYLWSMAHLRYLRQRYGPAVDPELAANDFARRHTDRRLVRAVHAIRAAVKRIVDPGDPPEIVEQLLDKLEAAENGGRTEEGDRTENNDRLEDL